MTRIVLATLCLCLAVPAWAQLPHSIPDFCASPTHTADSSGNWSTAGTWTENDVPGAGDIVLIPNGLTVTYDANSADAVKAVCVSGVFDWGTSGTRRLVVSELLIYEDGVLQIGTVGAPFTGSAIVEFNGTLDTGTVPSPGTDPSQWGVGLIAIGAVTVHGAVKTPFVEVASAVSASTSSISLSTTPTNWLSGDEIYLPESQQRMDGGSPDIYRNSEVLLDDRTTLSANVTGTTATLSVATTNAHPCSAQDKDSNPSDFCPHIANLTRTVRFISANPGGTRGHSIYVEYAAVDIRYAAFEDMGRTTDGALHCTLRTTGAVAGSGSNCTEGTGTITQIGTNQKGRYGVHFHHLWGPDNPGNTGYQAVFQGNVIADATKWPMTLHFTSYAHVADNVIVEGKGPGLFGEEYGEHFNVIEGNFIAGQTGVTNPREGDNQPAGIASGGREASGIWMLGGQNNYIRNNVAAGMGNDYQEVATEVGYKFFIHPDATSSTARIPDFRGARLDDVDEYTTADPRLLPILEFDNNEVYGMSTGMTIWHMNNTGYALPAGADEWSTISNLKIWHTWQYGFLLYPMHKVILDGMIVRSDRTKVSGAVGPTGIGSLDYKVNDVVFQNCNIQGVRYGFRETQGWDGDIQINGLTTWARVGIVIDAYSTYGTGANPTENRTMTIADFNHTTLPSVTNVAIDKNFSDLGNFEPNLAETVQVIRYQGTNQNFRVYYVEQGTQNVAGGQAPCNDTTTNPEILAVVCDRVLAGNRHRLRIRAEENAAGAATTYSGMTHARYMSYAQELWDCRHRPAQPHRDLYPLGASSPLPRGSSKPAPGGSLGLPKATGRGCSSTPRGGQKEPSSCTSRRIVLQQPCRVKY